MSEVSQARYTDHSLLDARWVLSDVSHDAVARLVTRHNIPEIIARLLLVRGIAEDTIESFMSPVLGKDFPDPHAMTDMKEAAAFVADAVQQGKKIGVFGDFDVDGATSTSLLVHFLKHIGQTDVPFHIPDRMKEGYGPNVDALRALQAQGAEIVIICDCGTTAHQVIAAGRALGLDILILDHHEAEEHLPDANFVINPKRKDDESELDMLAACGVVYLFCVAVNAALRDGSYYADKKISPPPLKNWLDIVALGTVCDMVPLQGCNRLFVKRGFEMMQHTDNVGLRALMAVSGIHDRPVNVYDAGFVLGPRINAGSRIYKGELGATLLSTEDAEEARNIAWTLNDCNDKRKDIQAEMLDHAISLVEREDMSGQDILIVGHEDWHPGLSGLVAGKLKEKYGKPAVAITYTTNEKGQREGRGSGRSVPGINLGGAFMAAEKEGLLIKGGGHAMAAGFSVMPEKVDDLIAFLQQHIRNSAADEDLTPEFVLDSVLSVSGVTVPLVQMIEQQFGPFGQDHPQPQFLFRNVKFSMVDVVGENHIKAIMTDWEGGSGIKTIAFGAKGTAMGDEMLDQGYNKIFDVVGKVKINSWNGRENAEIQIIDAILARDSQKKQMQGAI
ncbi:MAG: single-stranded-DNA-specific exonuclease RecJ [Alphaproteobacteria bacterium]|jgi:single-stranded-DNA-specific exonuclease|nr:single-stranded-DNA-specific exonuclease RecJ [Alphaproteobacteria bacterium]MDP7222784.1 single-stranded-DNA-specific exonuclease RecJ [Alphaproteobacteria bacterium]